MRRYPVFGFIVAAAAIAHSHPPRAQSEPQPYGDLSAIEQIAPPEETSSAAGTSKTADRPAPAEDQAAPMPEDICAPASAARRRTLGVTCVGDNVLILPDGSKIDREAFVFREDGVYLRVSPEPGAARDQTEGLLSLSAPGE